MDTPTVASDSFARFIFPFTTRVTAREGEGHEGQFINYLTNATWEGRPLWQGQPVGDDTNLKDLVRQFHTDSVRRWQLSDAALRDQFGFGERIWVLTDGSNSSTIDWTLTGIQFWWFEDHVGLLTFDAAPVSPTPDTWLAFLNRFRYLGGPRDHADRSRTDRWTHMKPGDGVNPVWMDRTHKGWTKFLSVIIAIMRSAKLGENEAERWDELTDAWQLFPYAGVFVEGLPEEEQPLFRHRFRLSFRANQAKNAAPEDLAAHGHPSFMAYADRQWFTFSMISGGFISFYRPEDMPFEWNQLPRHVRERYWFVLILVLHQHYALILFSRQIADSWKDLPGDTAAIEAKNMSERMEGLYRRLLTFTAHGYFTRLVQADHYHRFYRHWIEALQIEAHYAEVRDEIAAMRDWLDLLLTSERNQREKDASDAAQRRAEEAKRLADAAETQIKNRADAERQMDRLREEQNRRIEWRFNIFAVFAAILGFPGLALTAAASTGNQSWRQVVASTAIGLAVGFIILMLIFAVLWLIDRHNDNHNDKIPPGPIQAAED